MAKLAGRLGLTTPGRMKTSPKKRKLCRVAIARCDPVHRPEPRQNVRAEAEQPRDIAENKMSLEQQFRGHLVSYQQLVRAGGQPADRRINWRNDSACSRIEPGTTKAGVSTLG